MTRLPGVVTDYTSGAGSNPIPSAASLLAGGCLLGTLFLLDDTGDVMILIAPGGVAALKTLTLS
jgi:glycerate-2-kinase